MATAPTFVLVGHCGADSWSISNTVKRAVPQAVVTSAHDPQAVERLAKSGAVLLINRVLDGTFATDSGVDLIESLANQEPKPKMVLVSNFADAQEAAVAAGAMPGFGKSELNFPKTVELLRNLASTEQTSGA